MKKLILGLCAGVLLMAGVIAGRPAVHLIAVWWRESQPPLPAASIGTGDQSRLSKNEPGEVVPVTGMGDAAIKQLIELVLKAGREGRKISIAGSRHSMGGHTFYPGGLVLDMTAFRGMALDSRRETLSVGSGAKWSEVIPFLDQQGLAVEVMQSNNDFTVGGSVSVNCHGWQPNSPPIASTVESFRLLTADGVLRTCSRSENADLFSLALGGYGLFGVILDVDLRVVKNEFYRAEAHPVSPEKYVERYRELTDGNKDIGMAYGRLSVAPDSFLSEAVITLLKKQASGEQVRNTLHEVEPSLLNKLVFRGSVGSDYGKNLRWKLEKMLGETRGKILSRNEIMNEPSDWYANRDPNSTEILHEYFVPPSRLTDFVQRAREIFLRHKPDLLNVTIRHIETDEVTFLRYAPQEVFSLVMLFHQGLDKESEANMEKLTRALIDDALACGGTYYLPYRPHATVEQFEKGYPMAREFFALKRKYDTKGIFENAFSKKYGTTETR